ncbi:GGDEF domain-containing protein [Moritella marina ATCC 15381]|uniref:diguanylate cyclase n=1 Tax=Moritella marina ATCC 15381 TaxID=1202962 RepID=A0A5J6WKE8_MORMI|nr:GGDEF domain-containing protein [Moritella marina]QFI37914.1 GGDEF domain-containing protein [Moritella marina ATCC 15381]
MSLSLFRQFAIFITILSSYPVHALDTVNFDLRWNHQFQFAGYYAAIEKGYYQDEDIKVNIRAGSAQKDNIDEVISGRTDFSISNSELIQARLQGKPVVAISALFQYSPEVLLSLKSSNIHNPSALKNKIIATNSGQLESHLLAMLDMQDSPLAEQLTIIKKSDFELEPLITGKVDMITSYLTNQPYTLSKMGIDYNIMDPQAYGINFYSDFLFTSEQLISTNYRLVERFQRASIRGWQYALANPDEIINLILAKYPTTKSVDALRYEAKMMSTIMRNDLVELGHINPSRINAMAKSIIEFSEQNYDLAAMDGFLTSTEDKSIQQFQWRLRFLLLFFIIAACIIGLYFRLHHKLRLEIKEQRLLTRQLKAAVNTDPLSGIYNRRKFAKCYKHETERSLRYGGKFSIVMIDIDNFKQTNDTYGHEFGDEVIKKVASILADGVRDIDTCARYGGEEFILLLPNTDEYASGVLAERLRKKIQQCTFIAQNNDIVTITCSFGVAQFQGNLDSTSRFVVQQSQHEGTIACADKALYFAKKNSRNRVCYWSHITEVLADTA